MNAAVETEHGVYGVDLEADEVLGLAPDERLPEPEPVELGLPRVVAAASCGSTVVALVDRRPPLLVSHDAGATWREVGGGLPPGRAVALDPDNPDLMLYAARNRLFVSQDGGVFWRALVVELPEIRAVAFAG